MASSTSRDRVDGRAMRWAGQRERRRQEFVEAALRAIAEHGPEVSTEQIAEAAGVARTQLYRHFTDATDLHRAIAHRAVELINAGLAPLWQLQGTPMQMIRTAICAYIGWLSENGNLYRYLTMHSLLAAEDGQPAFADLKRTIGQYLTTLFEYYLTLFGLCTRVAEPGAFGVVGLVDSAAARWLESPQRMGQAELASLLTGWVWRLLEDTLRAAGVELDPDAPLPPPSIDFPVPQADRDTPESS